MLKTYWTSCGLMRRSQLDFAFESAREMGKSRPWIDFISSRLSVRDICQSELMDNLETLDAHPRLLLCHAAVNFIAEWSTDFPSDPLSKSRIRILIATVIRLFELYSTLETFQQKMMDAVLFLLADRMDKFVLCSDLESTEALSLLLSGFNEFADPEEMGLWCSHFSEYSKDMDPARFDSHDSVLLFKASMELKAFMYSESASKLIVVLMNRITRGGCDIYSIEDCQNALKDIQSSVREKLGSQPLFSW